MGEREVGEGGYHRQESHLKVLKGTVWIIKNLNVAFLLAKIRRGHFLELEPSPDLGLDPSLTLVPFSK